MKLVINSMAKLLFRIKQILFENEKLHWFIHVISGRGNLHRANYAPILAPKNKEY